MGPAVGAGLAEFQHTLPLRAVTDQLASALFNSEAPLTADQANALVDVLSRHAVDAGGRIDVLALNTDSALVDVQARGLLNTAQTEQLRSVIKTQQTQRQAERDWNTAPSASVRAAIAGAITSPSP